MCELHRISPTRQTAWPGGQVTDYSLIVVPTKIESSLSLAKH